MHTQRHIELLNPRPVAARQRGALTLFSAVLILILMSLMLFYAARVGLLETRVSANDVRVKQAFSAAEAAVDYGVKFAFANAPRLLSARENKFPDGLGGLTGDGWFSASDLRWQQCPDMSAWSQDAIRTHPCGGDFPMSTQAYYWETDGDASTFDSVVAAGSIPDLPAGTTARMTMVLCFVNLGNPAGGCNGNPGTAEDEYTSSLVLWMLGYGYSDCTDVNDVTTCLGEATVAKPVSNFRALQGSASVPLVAKSALPAGGTMEVVGNPNASGVGVTATSWVNSNHDECPPTDTNGNVMAEGEEITDFGTWQTCELQEWYHVEE